MKIMKLMISTVLLMTANLVFARTTGEKESPAIRQVCQLISDEPPGFNPFQFMPKKVDFRRLNRFPKVAFVVNEEGHVGDVKILKGSGSKEVDTGLVKSIQKWKYKPQPGCKFKGTMSVILDIGQN
jgi:TonB family protein